MSLFTRYKRPGPIKPTPNPYPSRLQKWRQSLGFTFVFILIVGGALRFYDPFYQRFQQGLFEGVIWVQTAFLYPFEETQNLVKDSYTFVHLQKEHARLIKENESLKWKLQSLNVIHHENTQLKQTLKVPDFDRYNYLTARILASPYDGIDHFFLIGAGEKEGLEKNQAIIVSQGIVGRLDKVGEHVSRVLLITDKDSRIPVMTSKSKQKAILVGGGKSALPSLVYLDDARKLEEGEQIITSGLGGVFPPGLPVGRIEKKISSKIIVRPYAPFQHIGWVRVLKPFSKGTISEIKSMLEGQ